MIQVLGNAQVHVDKRAAPSEGVGGRSAGVRDRVKLAVAILVKRQFGGSGIAEPAFAPGKRPADLKSSKAKLHQTVYLKCVDVGRKSDGPFIQCVGAVCRKCRPWGRSLPLAGGKRRVLALVLAGADYVSYFVDDCRDRSRFGTIPRKAYPSENPLCFPPQRRTGTQVWKFSASYVFQRQ